MTYDGTAFEVEFAARDGRAYALLPVRTDRLMLLRDGGPRKYEARLQRRGRGRPVAQPVLASPHKLPKFVILS
jgi:hypothetical protein